MKNELVTIRWATEGPAYVIVGRVRLEPGVGQHVVDVTRPDAPTLVSSPRMLEWLGRTPDLTGLSL